MAEGSKADLKEIVVRELKRAEGIVKSPKKRPTEAGTPQDSDLRTEVIFILKFVAVRAEYAGKRMSDAAHCPMCGEANECQVCAVGAYKGPCWCASVTVPTELLARVPAEDVNKRCICKRCIEAALREAHRKAPFQARAGDFYFEAGGLLVFTEAYHLRRGYCCGSGCRHCPYQTETIEKTDEVSK